MTEHITDEWFDQIVSGYFDLNHVDRGLLFGWLEAEREYARKLEAEIAGLKSRLDVSESHIDIWERRAEQAEADASQVRQQLAAVEAALERVQAAITEQRKKTWIDDTGRVRHPYENEFLDKLEAALNSTGE